MNTTREEAIELAAAVVGGLDPEDLKACRQVNSTLNKLIKAEMWGTKTGRSKLVKDLVHRWKTAEPRPVMIPVTQWDPVWGPSGT